MTQTLGILPLGRSTFDVEFAKSKLDAMLNALDALPFTIVGPRTLLFDSDTTASAIAELEQRSLDQLLVLQVTFTDAETVADIARRFDQPLSIWAVPEPRLGERLRLNAFCGLNLASHTLGLQQRAFGYLYADAQNSQPALTEMLQGKHTSDQLTLQTSQPTATAEGQQIVESVRSKRVACLGEHPAGFSTCDYDVENTRKLTGVEVTPIPLERLFETARELDQSSTENLHQQVRKTLVGVEELDTEQLDRSLRLRVGLDQLRAEQQYDAFAIRCWPETFTEYGGAVCAAVAMLGEERVPCACEADVYGAITQLILQETANAPVFLVDIVDLDTQDNSGVVWHCGQAPLSMCNPDMQAAATIHTNRKMPLLYEFPLKPGRVTFARLSQAHGKAQMIIGGGMMLNREKAFTGTSGVIEFDAPADQMLDNIMASGLEHHVGIVYGDYRDTLQGVAGALNIPVVTI